MSSKEQNMKLNYEVGQRVKSIRESLSISRKELAERVNISEYFLIEIESGRKGVSNITLCKIADSLCTTTDFLLRGKEGIADVSDVINLLSSIEQPLVSGAEELLKTYIASISYLKSQIDETQNTKES